MGTTGPRAVVAGQTLSSIEVTPPAAPVRLLYLAWGPLGLASLGRFLDLHQRFAPGAEHELLVILNNFIPAEAGKATEMVRGTGGSTWVAPTAIQDLDAYRAAATARPAKAYAFVNSYARPLADGWLGKLVAAAGANGLAGATGSFETQRVPYPPARQPGHRRRDHLSLWAAHAGPAIRSRAAFPPFPNVHLRTNAFAMSHSTFEQLHWASAPDKRAALAVEGGRRGLSTHASRLVLVDVDGNALPPAEWPDARVFRSGDQERLLVADNRTDQYATAGPEERRRLRDLAWGTGR